MAVRRILTAEDPLLRAKSKRVHQFGDALKDLVADMFETMYAAQGVGLAAPQIGVLQRLFVVGIPADYDDDGELIDPAREYVLVNPEIVRSRGEEEMEEGCLSVPGYRGVVKRATEVLMKGQDLNGKDVRYKVSGFTAQAFQHERDHLDGILYVNRVESGDKLWRINAEGEPEEIADVLAEED
ncbi:MAG: peptide deformylase [Chloroflexi bacterium]|nr:peptide deformylase [Chloroflexota bacterium]